MPPASPPLSPLTPPRLLLLCYVESQPLACTCFFMSLHVSTENWLHPQVTSPSAYISKEGQGLGEGGEVSQEHVMLGRQLQLTAKAVMLAKVAKMELLSAKI